MLEGIEVKNLEKLLSDGNYCSGTLADKVKSEFIIPIETSYKTIGMDWFGSAAAKHLPNIKTFHDDMVTMYNYLISLGNTISEIAEGFDVLEQQAGGDSRGITAVKKAGYTEVLSTIEKEAGQRVAITNASVTAGQTLKDVASKISTITTEISNKKNDVFSNWLSGGNPKALNDKMQEAIEKMNSFQKTVSEVVADIEAAHNVFTNINTSSNAGNTGSSNVSIN